MINVQEALAPTPDENMIALYEEYLILQEISKKDIKDTAANVKYKMAETKDIRRSDQFMERAFKKIRKKKYKSADEIKSDIKHCDKILADIEKEKLRVKTGESRKTTRVLFSLHFIKRSLTKLVGGVLGIAAASLLPTGVDALVQMGLVLRTSKRLGDEYDNLRLTIHDYRYLLRQYEMKVKMLKEDLESELKKFKSKNPV